MIGYALKMVFPGAGTLFRTMGGRPTVANIVASIRSMRCLFAGSRPVDPVKIFGSYQGIRNRLFGIVPRPVDTGRMPLEAKLNLLVGSISSLEEMVAEVHEEFWSLEEGNIDGLKEIYQRVDQRQIEVYNVLAELVGDEDKLFTLISSSARTFFNTIGFFNMAIEQLGKGTEWSKIVENHARFTSPLRMAEIHGKEFLGPTVAKELVQYFLDWIEQNSSKPTWEDENVLLFEGTDKKSCDGKYNFFKHFSWPFVKDDAPRIWAIEALTGLKISVETTDGKVRARINFSAWEPVKD